MFPRGTKKKSCLRERSWVRCWGRQIITGVNNKKDTENALHLCNKV